MKATISIALTTHNGERFLREQLDSIYSQTLLPDEVIACDDASTDGTVAILEEYQRQYGLKFYVNKVGVGCNRNFIQAFSLCHGDYICICDQDDIWLPNKIETVYRKIASMNQEKPLCVSSLRYDIDADGNIIDEHNLPESEGWQATLLSYGRSQGCTMIMNRKLCDIVINIANKQPDLAYQMYFDELIAYSAVIKGEKYNLSNKLMYYRHHDNNTVDPYIGKLTFRDKVQRVPTFYGFTIDERLIPLCVINKIFRGQIEDASLAAFLSDVEAMMEQKTVWQKLWRLLQCRQLAICKRIDIACKSTISITLKKLYNYPTA